MGAPIVTEEFAFLLTDIEGSTRLWEDQANAMPAALARHDALLATVIAAHGGRIFKTMGDGVFAVFAEPRPALEAAIAAQRALLTTDWREFGLDQNLTVRIALHIGPARPQNDDFAGPTLNRTARLLAAGHGAQILLFGAMASRIADMSGGVTYHDLGERRLRDVPGTERILQLVAPGLPSSFPPLRALDPASHNLPTPPTALIDRETELDRLRHTLTRTDTRLITLTGPGGIGKTRLALQVAFDLLDYFPDGVWFVDLSAEREDAQIVNAVIRVLDVPERAGQPPNERLHAWLKERELLIVLDNCEQVLAGAAALAAGIVRETPETRMLATSRASLGIRGEQQLLVEPLPLPSSTGQPELATVEASPSVQLFVARAAEARPAFALTAENATAVAGICQQVDGIPLALELAAARVAILPPSALQQRLTNRLPMLTWGARDLPARHQTLRAAIDWSYELLPDNEREVFRRFSVFAGGATLEALEGFFGETAGDALLEALAALVTHNLLRVDQSTSNGPRFSMLETIREYATEALESAQETAVWRDAHAGYFLELTVQAAPHLVGGPRQQEWMSRIDREYQNLRSAALWWLDRQEAQHVLELCTNIWNYWSVHGGASEGIDLIRRALSTADGVPSSVRAEALRKFGNLSIAVGDTRAARMMFEESLAIEQADANLPEIAGSLADLGMVAMFQGRSADYPALLSQSRHTFQEIGDVRGEAIALYNEASGARNEGQLDLAEAQFLQVMALQDSLQDEIGIAWSLHSLSRIARDRGALDEAVELSTRAMGYFLNAGDEQAIACVEELDAMIEFAIGNIDRARELLDGSLEIYRKHNDTRLMAGCLENLALVALRSADLNKAADFLNAAIHYRDQSGCPTPRIDAGAIEQLTVSLSSAAQKVTR